MNDARLLRNTLRYLDKHRDLPLCYRRNNNAIEQLLHEPNIFIINGAEDIDLLWMHDSNFATPKSQSGYCSILYGCTMSWKSKLQPIVAPSVSLLPFRIIALCFYLSARAQGSSTHKGERKAETSLTYSS